MEVLLCLLLTWLQYLPCPEAHSEPQWKGSQSESQLLWTQGNSWQVWLPTDPTVSRILWTRSCGKGICEVSYCCASMADGSGHKRQVSTQPSLMLQSQAPSLTRVGIKHSSIPPKPMAIHSKDRNTIHPSLSKAHDSLNLVKTNFNVAIRKKLSGFLFFWLMNRSISSKEQVQKATLHLCQCILKVISMTLLPPCPSHCDPAPAVSSTLMTAVYFRSEKEARQLQIIDIDCWSYWKHIVILQVHSKGIEKYNKHHFNVLISPKSTGKETSTVGKS